MTEQPRHLSFRPEINGLRAVAVILVIVFHLDKAWMPFGYVGVDIFFVISGFLITRIILEKQRNGEFKFGDFIARRIKRILPALFIVLLVCSIASILILSSEEYRYYFRSLRYASAQASNFFFLGHSGYFDLASKFNVLLHTWSLGVEEQFYLVWPLLLILVSRLSIPRSIFYAFVITSSFGAMWHFKNAESMQYFFMFYARAWEFAIGALLAAGVLRSSTSKLTNEVIGGMSILCISLPLFFASSTAQFELLYLLLTCIGVAGIIYSSLNHQTLIAKALSCKGLLYIGALSYSLYLWHWPVIVFYNYISEFYHASKGISAPESLTTIGVIIVLAVTWTLSAATYTHIEKRYRASKASNKHTFMIGAICIISFMGLAKLGQAQAKESWRLISFSNEINLNNFDIDVPRSFDSEVVTEDILLTGDSHSEHFAPMVEAWSTEQNVTSKLLSKGGTPPLLIYNQFHEFLSYRQKAHLDRVKAYILDHPEIKHVFLAANHCDYQNNPLYEKALADTVRFLIEQDKGVCIIGQAPPLSGNGIRFLEPTHLMNWVFPRTIDLETLLSFDPQLLSAQLTPMRHIMIRLQEIEPTLQLWHPEDHLSGGLQKGIPCYSDRGHLNLHGSLYLAPYFEYRLKEKP
ncbi:acyltransferase [Akkermansiaceae bacterium]|nr:acyltransferase [Akkermansiaceae bacterium]MDB4272758.1 acyltransferase [Akkermansiaceae bacterium]MDB4286606.1 acyltransferase [bacterium]MDB4332752.1 acyltransferase [Akkermansiaceae bacterium]MDC0265404.1 acyltransferase [bacterium]